jgi:hypothetical protein
MCWFRIPHKPPAGSLRVLHAPAHRGGIQRASKTKINKEPMSSLATRQNLAQFLAGTMDLKKIENLELKKNIL